MNDNLFNSHSVPRIKPTYTPLPRATRTIVCSRPTPKATKPKRRRLTREQEQFIAQRVLDERLSRSLTWIKYE